VPTCQNLGPSGLCPEWGQEGVEGLRGCPQLRAEHSPWVCPRSSLQPLPNGTRGPEGTRLPRPLCQRNQVVASRLHGLLVWGAEDGGLAINVTPQQPGQAMSYVQFTTEKDRLDLGPQGGQSHPQKNGPTKAP
jgi:hypothetical protein